MLADSKAFSGFAVPDLEQARRFYGDTLGLRVEERNGSLTLHLAGDRDVLVYVKPDHTPATYTILNFPVDDIDAAVHPGLDGLSIPKAESAAPEGVRFQRLGELRLQGFARPVPLLEASRTDVV